MTARGIAVLDSMIDLSMHQSRVVDALPVCLLDTHRAEKIAA